MRLCVCAWEHTLQLLCNVIGAHTYHLSVSLKLQNRNSIRKFPCSAFSSQKCFPLLFLSVSVSLWPFVQSSARLINHTHSRAWWHRWEQGGFIIKALGWEGGSDGGGWGLELSERLENTEGLEKRTGTSICLWTLGEMRAGDRRLGHIWLHTRNETDGL